MGFLHDIREAIGAWFARHARALAIAGGGLAAFVIAGFAGLYFLPQIIGLFASPLDTTQDLYAANRPVAISFVDDAGEVVGRRGAIVGQRLSLKQMPAFLPAAFIAMEDRSFWSNSGISVRGLVRAAWLNMRAGHVVAGGSTITQQVAKIVFTSQERTFARKFTELFDAAALNKSLTKTQILELYLNRIYLGSGAYGVDGAAHVYFGKSARELTLSEAAMLATLTRAPSAFSPRRDLAAAQGRAITVLNAMLATGAITEAQAQYAAAHPAHIVDRHVADARNYYFDTAADQARQLITAAGQTPQTDLIIRTPFDPAIEAGARKAVDDVLDAQGKKRHASEAAVVVMKPDGAVAALIGGRDYDDSVFNRATQAHRQPGSSFKPFVYLTALEQGLSPWELRTDEPVDIHGWSPTNFNNEHFGTVTLADALAHSVNTITAELGQEVGIANVVAAAHRLGIESPLAPNASIALGTSEVTPYEMTRAYAVFANGGMAVDPYFVSEVDDTAGHILYRRVAPQPERLIAAHVDRDLTAMLYEVVTDGTGRRAALPGREDAGKTGTTQDYHDAWFMGFTADYVTGVWVGNDDSAPMKYVTGGTLPAEIWHATMAVAEKGLAPRPLDKSAPEPPVESLAGEQNGVYVLNSGEAPPGGYMLGSGASPSGAIVQGEPPPQGPPQEEQRGFFDWLFGRDRPAPPPREEAQARGDYQPYDSYRRAAPPAQEPPAYDDGGPRPVPRYRWRSDPDWRNAPVGQQRQYGVNPVPDNGN